MLKLKYKNIKYLLLLANMFFNATIVTLTDISNGDPCEVTCEYTGDLSSFEDSLDREYCARLLFSKDGNAITDQGYLDEMLQEGSPIFLAQSFSQISRYINPSQAEESSEEEDVTQVLQSIDQLAQIHQDIVRYYQPSHPLFTGARLLKNCIISTLPRQEREDLFAHLNYGEEYERRAFALTLVNFELPDMTVAFIIDNPNHNPDNVGWDEWLVENSRKMLFTKAWHRTNQQHPFYTFEKQKFGFSSHVAVEHHLDIMFQTLDMYKQSSHTHLLKGPTYNTHVFGIPSAPSNALTHG